MIEFKKIIPNPKGKDKGKEWAEIWSSDNQKTYRNVEIIAHTEKSKKTIYKKDILLLESPTKIKLKNAPNSKASISIFVNGQKHDQIKYEKAPEGMWLHKTSIIQHFGGIDNTWAWSKNENLKKQEWKYLDLSALGKQEKLNTAQQNVITKNHAMGFTLEKNGHTKSIQVAEHKPALKVVNDIIYWPPILSLFIFCLWQIMKLYCSQKS